MVENDGSRILALVKCEKLKTRELLPGLAGPTRPNMSYTVFSAFRDADTVHNLYYRHRCPVHGTAYASLFLHPSASVITQLGQSCSAATRLSLHR